MVNKIMNKRTFLQKAKLIVLAGISTCFMSTISFAATKPIVFGIVPQQSATRLAQVWVPLIQHLSKTTGVEIKFATAKDIPTFEACLTQNAYDIAYMNPYHYTVFHQSVGYQAMAKQRDKKLKGVVVAKVGSDIENLADLDGKKVAFPSPAAFGASVIPRAEMSNQFISITPNYVKSHDSVYRSVALGLFPAGGGVSRTLNNLPKDIRAQLKIIYKTNGYTPHAFAASSSLGEDVKELITTNLIAIEDSALLQPLGMNGFERATNQDWNDVRALNLNSGQTEIVASGDPQCRLD